MASAGRVAVTATTELEQGEREGLHARSITPNTAPGLGRAHAHSQAKQTHQGSLVNSGSEDGEKTGKQCLRCNHCFSF